MHRQPPQFPPVLSPHHHHLASVLRALSSGLIPFLNQLGFVGFALASFDTWPLLFPCLVVMVLSFGGLLQGPLLLFLEGRFRCCCVKTICLIAGLVSAALKCLIETYQSFHCHPCLQSSFITSSFDFNVGHLLASFQPSSGRPSKPCRSSTDFDSSSPPVQSLTVHLILKTPGCFAEVGSFRAMLFRSP